MNTMDADQELPRVCVYAEDDPNSKQSVEKSVRKHKKIKYTRGGVHIMTNCHTSVASNSDGSWSALTNTLYM
jgi:hypothetical protein